MSADGNDPGAARRATGASAPVNPPQVTPELPIVSAQFGMIGAARVSVLQETDGDVVVPALEHNTILLTDHGASRFRLRGEDLRFEGAVTAGSVLMAPKGGRVETAWTNATPVQTVRLVEFSAQLFQDILPDLPFHRINAGHLVTGGFADHPEVAGLVRVLTRELDPSARRGRLYAESALRLLLLEVLARNWSSHVPMAQDGALSDSGPVRQAIDFVQSHLGHDISLTEIAAAAGMSASRLTRAFRDATGRTPYGYVIDQRIARAVRLLRTTPMPLAVIAFDCGFADQAHMTRLFRERLGTTPGAIRRG